MRSGLIGIAAVLATSAYGQSFGGFAPQMSFPTGTNPRQTKVADFNGDGVPDLATCNANSNDLSVVFGNGDGTFGSPMSYPAGQTPLSIGAADVDGDGDVDLAVAAGNGASISVYFNSGDGTFGLHQTYAFDPDAPPYPGVIQVHTMADFDGDGDTDIALVTLTASVVMILPNDGTGTFGPHQTIFEVTDGFPSDLEPGDFNGDGRIDLITINGYFLTSGGGAWMLLNNGDGSWSASAIEAAADGIVSPPADFDGDGNLDIAFTRTINPGGYMLVAMGDGDGTFGPQVTYNVNRPYPPTTADIDRDGDIDLIVPSFASYNTVSVMLNNGDGVFGAPLSYASGGANPQDIQAADLDGDHWLDLVCANRGGNSVSVFINLTRWTGDVNGDGVVDLSDLAALLSSFGQCSGDPGFESAADIDQSGCVDLTDLASLLANFGL